jgi:hypothetical protein
MRTQAPAWRAEWTRHSYDSGKNEYSIMIDDGHTGGPFRLALVNPYADDPAAAAQLMAAAPSLLDALQRLTHPMAGDDDLDYALDVIASAKEPLDDQKTKDIDAWSAVRD